jgi:Emfourin
MRVRFERSGGYAGIDWPPFEVETSNLHPDVADELFRLVNAADFFGDPDRTSRTSPSQFRDAMDYRVLIDDGSRQASRTFSEQNASAELMNLAAFLQELVSRAS